MESSSNDSFLWSDASNDSSDNRENKFVKLMETKYEDESDTGTNQEKKLQNKIIGRENKNKSKNIKLKTKKRKCSETMQESSDCSLPDRKRIKLEPESDIDIGKKNNSKNLQNSTSYNEEYLNFRVKQEEISLVRSKKKKKKRTRTSSNIETASQSDSATEPNKENYLELLVKQEQASAIVPEIVRSKKKKHKRCSASSDRDIASETKSSVILTEDTIQDELITVDDQTEYTITEEKICVEETVVEKRKKKKHKTNTVTHYNTDDGNKSKYINETSGVTTEEDIDNLNNISLEPNDFTCNNIVSSTILTTSAIQLQDEQVHETKHLLRNTEKMRPSKISDTIRFEEDDNSNLEESQSFGTSPKINLFLKVNPQLKLWSSQTSLGNLITTEDEIWTVTWPHEIKIEKLRNTTLLFDGKCKIKIDGQRYEGIPNEFVNTISLLSHKNTQAFINNVPVKACIDYHKRIPKVHIPNNNIMVDNQRNFTPLPETKCRHPLFGAHYKKAIKISTAVKERLQAAKGLYNEYTSESIKKKHKKDKYKSADMKTEQSVSIKVEHESLKKSKKRKNKEDQDSPPKKFKRVNHNNTHSPTVWESEKAIEENLFNF